jgi:hypothetical protein
VPRQRQPYQSLLQILPHQWPLQRRHFLQKWNVNTQNSPSETLWIGSLHITSLLSVSAPINTIIPSVRTINHFQSGSIVRPDDVSAGSGDKRGLERPSWCQSCDKDCGRCWEFHDCRFVTELLSRFIWKERDILYYYFAVLYFCRRVTLESP